MSGRESAAAPSVAARSRAGGLTWPARDGGPATRLSTGKPLKWAEIDVDALRENATAVCRRVGARVAVMAMVKANGYGHGAEIAARAFVEGGASWLGVSCAEEALQLRAAGLDCPILIVGWSDPSTLDELIRSRIDLTVCDDETVRSVAAAALSARRPARVHVKVDTGMNRIGVRLEQLDALLDTLVRAAAAVELRGVFTHHAEGDAADLDFAQEQHERFLGAVQKVRAAAPSVLVHCANSAITLRCPQMWHDIVRPGLALYGYMPANAERSVAVRPALTMVASITQVKTVHAGESVGYGRTWTAARDTVVATAAAGYADGIFRAQSNAGTVLVRGARCPIIGRVSMDQITIDVSGVEGVTAGEEAVLVGGDEHSWLGADEVAAVAGTVAYEVLCAVSARVPRIAVSA